MKRILGVQCKTKMCRAFIRRAGEITIPRLLNITFPVLPIPFKEILRCPACQTEHQYTERDLVEENH
jgi:hypothetical protein